VPGVSISARPATRDIMSAGKLRRPSSVTLTATRDPMSSTTGPDHRGALNKMPELPGRASDQQIARRLSLHRHPTADQR